MSRRRRGSNLEPIQEVVALQERLEEQLGTFLKTVGERVLKYEARLKKVHEIMALEEERKATFRATNHSNTVTITHVTQPPKAAATSADDETAAAAAAATQTSTERAAADDLDAPHYVVTLQWDENHHLLQQLQVVRHSSMQLADVLDSITDYLALSMPNLNEENSVYAGVLGAMLEQVTSFVETVRAIVGFPKKYLDERATMEKDILKLPESSALQLQLELNDAETWDEIVKSWKVLIRVCLIMRSVLVKNMPTLQEQAPSATQAANAAMYY